MRVGFRRGEVVDGDDCDVLAFALDNCAQHHAADAAKSINGNPYCHHRLLLAPNACPKAPVTASTRGYPRRSVTTAWLGSAGLHRLTGKIQAIGRDRRRPTQYCFEHRVRTCLIWLTRPRRPFRA